MLSINEATKRLSILINSRISAMRLQVHRPIQEAPQAIGEMLLDRFALQLIEATSVFQQEQASSEELLENLLAILAIAGLMGIDLEQQLDKVLNTMESVSGEAS